MDAFLSALAPHFLELIAAILTIILGWLAAQARTRWGRMAGRRNGGRRRSGGISG